MILYLDSSAIVKLYVEESGSELVREYVGRAQVVGTSIVSRAECTAAFKKLDRAGALSTDEARACREAFADDWTDFFRLDLTSAVADRAESLAWDHDLRGYDAVQLAAALQWDRGISPDVTLGTWDVRLKDAALTVGLDTIPEELG